MKFKISGMFVWGDIFVDNIFSGMVVVHTPHSTERKPTPPLAW